jgi:hypothetical protein
MAVSVGEFETAHKKAMLAMRINRTNNSFVPIPYIPVIFAAPIDESESSGFIHAAS